MPLVVIPGMMKAAEAFYADSAVLKQRKRPKDAQASGGRRARQKLALRDPW